MAQVRSIASVHLTRSLKAIQDIRLRREAGKPISVAVKALGAGFAPSVLDASKVSLHVVVSGVAERDVHGTLQVVESEDARGLWFHYVFVPLHPEEVETILSWGLNHFSPIESVTFIFEGVGYLKRNFFFCPAATPLATI